MTSCRAGFLPQLKLLFVLPPYGYNTKSETTDLALLCTQHVSCCHDNNTTSMFSYSPDIESIFPLKTKMKDEELPHIDKGFTLRGTLRGLGFSTLKKLRQPQGCDVVK